MSSDCSDIHSVAAVTQRFFRSDPVYCGVRFASVGMGMSSCSVSFFRSKFRIPLLSSLDGKSKGIRTGARRSTAGSRSFGRFVARRTNGANEPGGRQKDEQMQEKELDAVFALIDYIAAVLARLLCQMAGKKYWWNNVVAFLAQRVTKLKVLMLDMHTNTIISCQAGEAALDRTDLSSRLSSGILDEEECEEVLRMIDADAKQGLRTTANTDVARYCVEQNRFRSGINLTFRYLLMALRFQNRLGLQGTSFEICGMVYATGFEDFKALLFQDLDLEYSASSDQDTLNTAYPAFEILNQTLANVKQVKSNPLVLCKPLSNGGILGLTTIIIESG